MSEKKIPFPKVKAAREALKERAMELFEAYMALAAEAKEAKEFEVAADIYWKLIEHMPAEDNERLIDPSATKAKQLEAPVGPSIQIGIALGGIPRTGPKKIDPATIPRVIDITGQNE